MDCQWCYCEISLGKTPKSLYSFWWVFQSEARLKLAVKTKDPSKWSLTVHSVHSDLKRKITEFLLHSTLWVGQERGNVFSRQTAGWGWMNKTIWWWSSKEKTSPYSTQGDQLELSNLCSSNRCIEEGIPFIPCKVSDF